MAQNPGRKRISYTNEQKLNCIKRIRSGTRPSVLVKELGVPKSTVSTWLRLETTIQAAVDRGQSLANKNRTGRHSELDEALTTWFHEVRDANTPVDGQQLLTKANSMADCLGSEPVNKAWIDRWKRRHNILLKPPYLSRTGG